MQIWNWGSIAFLFACSSYANICCTLKSNSAHIHPICLSKNLVTILISIDCQWRHLVLMFSTSHFQCLVTRARWSTSYCSHRTSKVKLQPAAWYQVQIIRFQCWSKYQLQEFILGTTDKLPSGLVQYKIAKIPNFYDGNCNDEEDVLCIQLFWV